MKYPWMQFFVTDWLTDPQVSVCEPATRGILVDWLCNMHLLDRSGLITGTREHLARLGRCTVVHVESALQDLIQSKTADVTLRNSVVTVVNRRMRREYLTRKNGAIRAKRHRSNVARNATVTAHSHNQSHISEGGGCGNTKTDEGLAKAAPDAKPKRPPLEKVEDWKLRKDLRESTNPEERAVIKQEIKRRALANVKPQADTKPTKPVAAPIPFEKRKELWEKAKQQSK